MKIEDQNKLIIQAVNWAMHTAGAIQDAGGDVEAVMKQLPPELVATMVRNNLTVKYN